MLLLNQPDTPDNALSSTGNIDTSHIYLSLKDKYQSNTEKALEVDFRSLLPWVKLGDQFTHLIHPYPAKLIPHIANFFINASVLAKKGDIVLDPFSGSGTVALEASLAGRTPHISDANPLALLISKVKTFNYNIDELTNALMDISGKAKRYKVAPEINVVNSSVWYSEFIKKKLEIILRAIMQLENNDIRDFFRICFSVTARKLSNADPAISVPVKLKCKPNFSENRNNQILKRLNWLNSVSVIDEFTTISLLNINRVRNANEFNKNRISAKITSHNVNDLSDHYDSNEKPSLIITSPPYGSAQKYIRSSSLSLNWLGFTEPENLIKLEDISIGREHAHSTGKKITMINYQINF
ncbi:hypothetical protein H4F63_21280 [Pectobacterium brasiliense]|nr:DNA methyltransferase [Pectobacterium brasiliense]MBN3129922.1 hypothetical protein [Pectobacterium brasiliense]